MFIGLMVALSFTLAAAAAILVNPWLGLSAVIVALMAWRAIERNPISEE